ncbi:MAG: hypothetical protein C0513_08385 [Isosphaera sp.]|nr:hypothetical protein [Isosphaera sp.]
MVLAGDTSRARARLGAFLRLAFVHRPVVGVGGLIAAAVGLCVWVMLDVMSADLLIAPEQVMRATRTVRVPFSVEDLVGTEAQRQSRRERAPRVLIADTQPLDQLRLSLENLPRTAAAAATLDNLTEAWRQDFAFTPELFDAALGIGQSPDAGTAWAQRVAALHDLLRRRPVVDNETYQAGQRWLGDWVEVRWLTSASSADATGLTPQQEWGVQRTLRTDVLALGAQETSRRLREAAGQVGFLGQELELVARRLARLGAPTHKLDPELTALRQQEAADSSPVRTVGYEPGQVIYQRGQVLTPEQYRLARQEARAYAASEPLLAKAVRVVSHSGTASLVAAVFWGVCVHFSARLSRSPRRLAMTSLVCVGSMALASWAASAEPRIAGAALTGPAALGSMVLLVALERRAAVAIAAIVSVAVTVILRMPGAAALGPLAGVAALGLLIGEVRSRKALIVSGAGGGIAAGLTLLVVGGLTLPPSTEAITQSLWQAVAAAGAVFFAGFFVLGALPLIERAFGVTTGLTLVEMRDPSHPLLRQLQQRAPGTYSHSLNVATLAEAACNAVSADALLAYVGALYHDVGKMNKPDYFVENQAGVNRHDKLAPNLSLLVIVGHVKDGAELARAYQLPPEIAHFIEAHHGTTLVEYFFHRARRQAEGHPDPAAHLPQEIEYRYPGPRPRTREVAILMVCDAAESAARAMAEPSAVRIEAMVRAIANRRLLDGQFDECDLTLRDLARVVDAVSRTLVSIYHTRVSYPSGADAPEPSSEPEPAVG